MNLMPHQDKALNLTENFNHVAYYLDMGLGKTFVGAEKMYLLNNAVNLVICQKSKVDDWVEHFTRYYPEYHVLNLTKKSEAITFRNKADTVGMYDQKQIVGIINYETAMRRSWLLNLTNFTLMLDESSLIQNENAKRSKFVLKMKPESVILLSGTPTAGKYEKLWSQLKLLGWDIDKKGFWASYVDTKWVEDGDYHREVIVGYKRVEHLKKKLAQFGAIFMKTEEVLNLPERIEQNIMLNPTKEYKHFEKSGYLILDTLNLIETDFTDHSDFWGKDVTPKIELVGDNALTKMMYERQLCGQYHKEKLDAFRDLVESTEDRLIVFYNFTAEYLAMVRKIQDLKRPQSIINGKQKQTTCYEKYENSITFIQYQAGAMGGNFQKANKVIYFTLPLGKGSCDLWEQSKKRVHRIGQKTTCFYYYLLVRNSIEIHNFESLKLGKDLTDELFKND